MLIEQNPSMKAVFSDGNVIVVDMALGRCFALNGSAATIWNALETRRTIDDVCTILTGEFEVTAEDCRPSVDSLIDDWRKNGLVRTID